MAPVCTPILPRDVTMILNAITNEEFTTDMAILGYSVVLPMQHFLDYRVFSSTSPKAPRQYLQRWDPDTTREPQSFHRIGLCIDQVESLHLQVIVLKVDSGMVWFGLGISMTTAWRFLFLQSGMYLPKRVFLENSWRH